MLNLLIVDVLVDILCFLLFIGVHFRSLVLEIIEIVDSLSYG